MLNYSHHRPCKATVTRNPRSTRERRHPEEPDVRPTSPVLREGPPGDRGSLLGGQRAQAKPSTLGVGSKMMSVVALVIAPLIAL
jgi:hypothetical protein